MSSSTSSFDALLARVLSAKTVKPGIYLAILLAATAGLLAPFAAAVLFLLHSGELRKPRDVATWLQQNNGIYGTAINNNLREIAFSIYLERKPDIIVMSSSRGVDFREEFFTRSFSCVCSIMSNVEEGIQFFDAVKDIHLPAVAIIGLDYWWFSTTDDHSTVPWPGVGPPVALTQTKIRLPYEWIAEGKLTVRDFLSVAAGLTNISPLSRAPKLGVQAMKLSNGTRADGTWSPLGTVSTVSLPVAIWGKTIRMATEPELILSERSGRYAPDQKLADDKLALLRHLIEEFHQRGTKVVLMLLPIINPVVETMEKTGRYQFIWDVRRRLAELGTEYHDFFDPRDFGGVACEFKDTHHGGNALYKNAQNCGR